jgi:hypothetical protein
VSATREACERTATHAGKIRGSELSEGSIETISREMKIFNACEENWGQSDPVF